MMCRLVNNSRRFGVAFFLHLQGHVDYFNLKVKAYKSVFFLKEKVYIIKFLHSVNKNDFI
jgi:hypothetical protein